MSQRYARKPNVAEQAFYRGLPEGTGKPYEGAYCELGDDINRWRVNEIGTIHRNSIASQLSREKGNTVVINSDKHQAYYLEDKFTGSRFAVAITSSINNEEGRQQVEIGPEIRTVAGGTEFILKGSQEDALKAMGLTESSIPEKKTFRISDLNGTNFKAEQDVEELIDSAALLSLKQKLNESVDFGHKNDSARNPLFSDLNKPTGSDSRSSIAGHIKFENALKEYKEKEIERIKKIDDEAFGLMKLMDSYRTDPDFSMNKVGIVGTNEDKLWRKATREHIATEEQRRVVEDNVYLAVLAPNKFMLNQDGEAVLYDHEASANALARAKADEYINLNTVDGTTLIARNVVNDPSSISVLEEDDEVYLSTKIKSKPDKDDYTTLYAVRTTDEENKPINMILAEHIKDGKVVSKNEEAMKAVGLEPNMFVTKVPDVPRPGENGFTHEDLDITTVRENNLEQIRFMTQLSPGGLAEIINKAKLDKNLKQRAGLGNAATAPVNAEDVMSADDLKREGDVKTLRAMSGFDQTTSVIELKKEDLIALNYAIDVYSPRNEAALSDQKEKYNAVKKEGLVAGVAITQKTKLSTDYYLVSTSVIRAEAPYSKDIDVITTTYEKSFKSVTPGHGLKTTVNMSEKLGNIERVGYLDANIMSSEFANKSFSPLNKDGTTNPNIKLNNAVSAKEVASVIIDNGFENWTNIQNTQKGMFRKGESINTYDQMAESIEKTQLETSQEKDVEPEQDVKKDNRGGLRR